MNKATLIAKLQFQMLLLTPFLIVIMLIALLFGCQQKPKEQVENKPTVTLENLQVAYNKQVNYSHMYDLFAQRADKDRLKNVAALFRAVSQSELVHAKVHADLMKSQGLTVQEPKIDSIPVGSTIQTIKLAMSSEDIEVGSMYPNLIRTADLEKFPAAKEQFEHVRDADARQKDLLEIASNGLAQYAKATYLVCEGCGYIFNTDKTDECPICGAKKNSFKKV